MTQEPPSPDDHRSVGDVGAEYRNRSARVRRQVRQRYREHLMVAFSERGLTQPAELADAALDALTVWRFSDSGERCRCGCHPQLPESDLHDYGFGCVCRRTRAERRYAFDQWRDRIATYRRSPEGQADAAAEQAAETALQTWLAGQEGVAVTSRSSLTPEEWHGEIDGHSFSFHQRLGAWRIEVDLRPSDLDVRANADSDDSGPRDQAGPVDHGDVIAYGTTDPTGDATTLIERAQFIIATVRAHLGRQACTHHREKLPSIEALLGTQVGWCPTCGMSLQPS